MAIDILQTETGIRIGLRSEYATYPAPTVLILSSTMEESLENPLYCGVADILAKYGFLCLSLDLPCHGQNRYQDELEGLNGWRSRLEAGNDLVSSFTQDVSSVLDFLIRRGYIDVKRIAACGTSRGGFMALHAAAADKRIGCVAVFSPVTALWALTEFADMRNDGFLDSLALVNIAPHLADRAVWVCIGNNDVRVNTQCAIDFACSVMRASHNQRLSVNSELHVVKGESHSLGHCVHATAHEEAAKWLLRQLQTS